MWLPAYDRTVEHRFDPRYAAQPGQKRDCYTVQENGARYALVVLELHVHLVGRTSECGMEVLTQCACW